MVPPETPVKASPCSPLLPLVPALLLEIRSSSSLEQNQVWFPSLFFFFFFLILLVHCCRGFLWLVLLLLRLSELKSNKAPVL